MISSRGNPIRHVENIVLYIDLNVAPVLFLECATRLLLDLCLHTLNNPFVPQFGRCGMIMPYSHSKAHDERFLADLQRNYRGTARVSLDLLTQFGPYVRDADHKVIGSLERSIRDDDKRHLVQTYIPVKLTEEKFEEALEQLGIRRYDLLEQSRQPRLLELPAYSLICLHGRQRLEAARLCLNGKERWWPVKLYVEGLLN